MKRAFKTYILDRLALLKSRDSVIDLPSHTVSENRKIWNNYDWSKQGEEWTHHASNPEEWKKMLLDKMMYNYIQPDSIILEIGCGAGRWSEYLQKIAKTLYLVDIAPRCIEICKERFKDIENIYYHVVEDNLEFIPTNTINFVWSYDVFVHINPSDVVKYIQNISRILTSGGIAIIHHSDEKYQDRKGFRSKMTSQRFADYVKLSDMKMIEQNGRLPHMKGDVISVFMKNLDTPQSDSAKNVG